MHWTRGHVTRQAHVDLPTGTVEEEYARRGFFGRTSHLYRTSAPVEWTSIEGDCRPHALCATEAPGLRDDDWLLGRIPLLANADVGISMSRLAKAMPYFMRNADADEVLFVHGGAGLLETDFGPLHYERGDYLVIPRGTVYRLSPNAASTFLAIESADEVGIPDKGLLGRHALFDPDVIEVPTPDAPNSPRAGDYELKIKRLGKITTVTYPFHPINTVGWKGDLTVWRLNVRDIRPIMSERYHLPPSAHATFVMPNVVICTFLPRGLETGDPNALRVPFYHSNIDYDEVLFYHDGDFFSRAGIRPGMMTFHPQGIHHGPQPQAVAAAATKQRTTEQAVMIDTRRPLELTQAAAAVSVPDYWKSWNRSER
jgi:homogentisate 1,2-dioxygenase